MSIFNLIEMAGGLALFLYGMQVMGDGLKAGSSGALKNAIAKVTNSPWKGFILGVLVTGIIQSSTATIVLTSGLVGAGLVSLHQSVGIILGANVGTTVTGQIIRLLDIEGTSVSWLAFFQPDTLAIGGGVSNEDDRYLLTPLRCLVERESLPCNRDRMTKVVRAELGTQAGIIGAAFLGKNKA